MPAAKIFRFPVLFHSAGVALVGRIHRNVDNLIEVQPGLVVTGSWFTVKEQMPDRYAAELAARGYTVLTFDFAGFGESGGEPRQTEMPVRKVTDISAAAHFLGTCRASFQRRSGMSESARALSMQRPPSMPAHPSMPLLVLPAGFTIPPRLLPSTAARAA
jgi:hypothetical protein